MADKKKDVWNDDDEEETRPKRRGLRRFLLFFLILLAVLAVVLAAAWRDGTGLDILRRYFSYRKEDASVGYVYDPAPGNRFAAVGDSLAVLSESQLSLQGADGETLWSAPVKMTGPALASGGGYAVAYDVGGTELYVLDQSGLKYQLTAGEEEPYICARLNGRGDLAVTAKKRGYKAAVCVYDLAGTPRFEFKSSERFVTDARVDDDGKMLTAVTLGQSGGAFACEAVFYDLTQKDPIGSAAVSGGMCLGLGQIGRQLTVVGDEGVSFGVDDQDGQTTSYYSYAGEFLREYDLGGEDYAVLLLNRYRSGNMGRLATVGPDGQELASLPVNQEIYSVSAAGRYIAVLTADHLTIYNSALEVYADLSGTNNAREALALADGSALLLSADRAVRFLP